MNRTLARLRALAVVSALGVAFVHSHGFAQEATPAPAATQDQNAPVPVTTTAGTSDQEVLVLSPFVVEADEDTGYAATSTLAGTRIKTNLKDVGDAVSVVTKKFLQDTDSNNSQDLLVYTTNTEVGGQGGNFAGTGNTAVLSTQGAQESPQTNTRVRGLAAADNTRGYFLTDIPWDSYNTDRIDIQRGPNSILFGLGSPAGIINASINDANLGKDSGSLTNRFGSFGSVRTSLDYNKVLLPDELAIRLDILDDQTDYAQRPTFNDSRRYFGALHWDPKFLNQGSAHTDIRVTYEHGEIDANNPSVVPPVDEITPWFTAMNKALYGSSSIGWNSTKIPVYDGSNPFTGTFANVLNNPLWGARNSQTYSDTSGNSSIANPNSQNWLSNNSVPNGIFNGGGLMAVFPNANSSSQGGPNNGWLTTYANEIDGPPGSGATSVVTGLGLGALGGITSYNNYATFANLPNSGLGLYKAKSLALSSVFNFYNTSIEGPNNYNDQNWNAVNAALSETFFNGRVGVEAVLDHQEWSQSSFNPYGNNPALSIDDMATLLSNYSAQAFEPANPNAGRAGIGGNGGGDFNENKRTNFRVTAFANLDFSDYFDKSSWIARIFGKSVFTGLYSKSTENQFSYNYGSGNTDGYVDNALNSSGFGVGQIAYLSPDLQNATLGNNLQISGITAHQQMGPIGTMEFFNLTPNPNNPAGAIQTTNQLGANYSGNPFTYLGYTPTQIQVESAANGQYLYNSGANKDVQTITSRALVWQGFFLDGMVVPTVGWRADEATDQNAGNPPKDILPDKNGNGRFYDPFDPSFTVSTGPNDPRNGINNVVYNSVSGHSTSYSVVIHTPKFIKEKMPLQTDISLLFDQSSNFQPAAGRFNIDGTPVPAPTGKTTEKGFVITTLNDRLTLKINWYKTQISNGSLGSGGGVPGVYEVGYGYGWGDSMDTWAQDGPGNPQNWMFTNNFNLSTTAGSVGQVIDPSIPSSTAGTPNWLAYQPNAGQTVKSAYNDAEAVLTNFLLPANQPSASFLNYWAIPSIASIFNHDNPLTSGSQPGNFIISDNTLSKGVEYELTAQPVKNWDLTFNASKTYATVQNVAGSFTEFVQGEENFFHSAVPGSDEGNIAGDVKEWNGYLGGQTVQNTFDTQFWGNYLYQKSLTGTGVSEERPWRFNIISDYTISQGPLKNVNFGGSYRWQDKQVIGYPFVNGTFNTAAPYKSPVDDTFDAWVGYSRKLTNKIKWRVQLNVRNLFYSTTLIPINTEPDGSVAESRIPEPRTWEITNSLTF